MNMTVKRLTHEDSKELFSFENENRTYFERMVPSRGEEYYQLDTFLRRHEELLAEQDQGLSYFYLIRDQNGEILGRVNVVDIDRWEKRGAIGYRVGERHIGKGVAKKALRILLDDLRKKGFTQILGKTTTNNVGSQKVLEKNGFQKVEESDEEFVMNGETVRFVQYVWSSSF